MPLTIAQVVALPGLGLALRTDSGDHSRPVRWVATSELTDPGPWLDGDELLLTTGMRLTDDPAACEAYVAALGSGGVSAIGFGVGLSFETIPEALLTAAERAALPVIEVPTPTPFVAVSKAVSRALAAEEYEDAERSFEAQRALIRAAVKEQGDAKVVALVARHAGGFAMLVDAAGVTVCATPASAARRIDEFTTEIERLRPLGVLASSAIATAEEHVAIVPLGLRGSARGFLIVGSTQALRAGDIAVMNLATSLLSWGMVRELDRGQAWNRLAMDVIRREGSGAIPMTDLGLGGLVRDRAHIVVMMPRGDAGELASMTNVLSGAIASVLDDQQVLAFLPAQVAIGREAGRVLDSARSAAVSGPVDLADPYAVEATIERACRAAVRSAGVTRLDDPAQTGLAGLIDPVSGRAWAQVALAGVLASGETTELIATLRAWLDNHGQIDATGVALGVHRHTVRHRLRRAESLLGVSLDAASVRAELWFALENLDSPLAGHGSTVRTVSGPTGLRVGYPSTVISP